MGVLPIFLSFYRIFFYIRTLSYFCFVYGRYHLQAFRHLYVLAAEPRVLVPREVDSNKACHVPLEVTMKVSAKSITTYLCETRVCARARAREACAGTRNKTWPMIFQFCNMNQRLKLKRFFLQESQFHPEAILKLTAPCILPELHLIKTVNK